MNSQAARQRTVKISTKENEVNEDQDLMFEVVEPLTRSKLLPDDGHFAVCGVVNDAAASRDGGYLLNVTALHQFGKVFWVAVLLAVKKGDRVLEVGEIDSFDGGFLSLVNGADIVSGCGQRIAAFFGAFGIVLFRAAAGQQGGQGEES